MATSGQEFIFVGSDNDIEILGLKVRGGSSYVNDATVTFTLRSYTNGTDQPVGNEAVVASQSEIEMPYVALSQGHYKGTLADTVAITAGTFYWIDITATADDGVKRVFRKVKAIFEGTEGT